MNKLRFFATLHYGRQLRNFWGLDKGAIHLLLAVFFHAYTVGYEDKSRKYVMSEVRG